MTQPSSAGSTQYPPDVYAPAVPSDLTAAPPASLWRWFCSTAAAGLPIALAWWLAAPGGLLYGDRTDPSSWLARDLVLGLFGVLAGMVTALLLLPQLKSPTTTSDPSGYVGRAYAKVVAAVLGCAVGSLLAWQLGTLAGTLWAHPEAGNAASAAFSLRSPGVLVLWPLACAVVIFAVTVAGVLLPRQKATSRGR
jgi:hypothetical protein